jgi:WD40 repeat protein
VQNNKDWILPVCVLVGAAAAGIAYFVIPSNQQAPPAAPLFAGGPEVNNKLPIEPIKIEPFKGPFVNVNKDEPPPEPKAPRASFRIRKLPAPEKLEGLEKNSYDVADLTIDDAGTRVLAKSKREVNCLDLASGRILHTFRPAKPRSDFQKPDTKYMFLSPDTKYVMVGSESHSGTKAQTKEMITYSADDGQLVGIGKLNDRSELYHFTDPSSFTPNGDYLLLPSTHFSAGFLLQALTSRTGSVELLNFPGSGKMNYDYRLLLPVPGEPVLIVYRDRSSKSDNPGGVAALDLRTGAETPITSLTIKPWTLFYDRGVQLSLDGTRVLSQGIRELQVCDWRSNQRLLEMKVGSDEQYNNARFTPDGKRFVVLWTPHYQLLHIGGPKSGFESVPSELRLYDIATQTKIATFIPKNHGLSGRINALAISRDGKTLAWGADTSVVAIDFRAAFGIDPLPPTPRHSGPDVLR